MNDPLRIGLIGAGMIGRKHVAYLKASPDCDLVAIADPFPGAKAIAAEHAASTSTTVPAWRCASRGVRSARC